MSVYYVRPSLFSFTADPKVVVFCSVFSGGSQEIPCLAILFPNYPNIRTLKKIKTFSDLPVLFIFSMQ